MDINKASREQLEKAFQVDGQRSEYIVRKREELGGFDSWNQIKEVVPGFEDKMVDNLQAAGLTLGRKERGRDTQVTHGNSTQERSSARATGNESNSPRDVSRRDLRDINDASAEELKRAFQVDGERAQYLVEKRREMGGFKSWDDIKQHVPSFEDKMIDNLEEAGFTLGKAA